MCPKKNQTNTVPYCGVQKPRENRGVARITRVCSHHNHWHIKWANYSVHVKYAGIPEVLFTSMQPPCEPYEAGMKRLGPFNIDVAQYFVPGYHRYCILTKGSLREFTPSSIKINRLFVYLFGCQSQNGDNTQPTAADRLPC